MLPPLPLTDGGAKTKQPSRLRGFRPYHGEASPHPLLLPQCGPGLIQGLAWLELGAEERQRPETMPASDDESRGGPRLKRTVIKEQSFPHNGSGSPIVRREGN